MVELGCIGFPFCFFNVEHTHTYTRFTRFTQIFLYQSVKRDRISIQNQAATSHIPAVEIGRDEADFRCRLVAFGLLVDSWRCLLLLLLLLLLLELAVGK